MAHLGRAHMLVQPLGCTNLYDFTFWIKLFPHSGHAISLCLGILKKIIIRLYRFIQLYSVHICYLIMAKYLLRYIVHLYDEFEGYKITFFKLGSSATLRAIIMCLRSKIVNGLVSFIQTLFIFPKT